MAIRRRKKPNLVLPLSSMGDIAFLLIIFFMLASNFMKTGNVDLQRPGAPTLEQQEPAKCSVMVDRDGVVWCDGAQVSAGNEFFQQFLKQINLAGLSGKFNAVILTQGCNIIHSENGCKQIINIRPKQSSNFFCIDSDSRNTVFTVDVNSRFQWWHGIFGIFDIEIQIFPVHQNFVTGFGIEINGNNICSGKEFNLDFFGELPQIIEITFCLLFSSGGFGIA